MKIKAVRHPRISEKGSAFSGEEREFPQWSFIFVSALGVMGLDQVPERAGDLVSFLEEFDTDMPAKAVWHLLDNIVRDKAWAMCSGSPPKNALVASERLTRDAHVAPRPAVDQRAGDVRRPFGEVGERHLRLRGLIRRGGKQLAEDSSGVQAVPMESVIG